MTTRIALTEEQFHQLTLALEQEQEAAAVIASTLVLDTVAPAPPHEPGDVTLLANTVNWIAEDAYLDRHAYGLSIRSTGWVHAFRAAIASGRVPVFVHTHPSGRAEFSERDDLVDQDLAAAARDLGATAYASIVVAGTTVEPNVVARLCRFNHETGAERPERPFDLTIVDAVRIVGTSLRLFLPPASPDESARGSRAIGAAVFDRQIRMLGPAGQRTLAALNIALIGAGGTGSAIGVQLTRLGVGGLCLIDDDIVTNATPTRGHGMTMADVGRPKVDVLEEHLRDIGFDTHITTVNAQLHDSRTLRAVAQADVVFSCVDGHGARLILNRLAYAHIAPVIDLAVLVTPRETGGVEIDERVTWLAPGAACLLCRGRLDPARAYAENLDPEARKRLAGEGYVVDVETPQPAVVTLTTLVAALGATEFLLRFTGLGSPEATELLLRPHLGELRRNSRPARTGCFCVDANFHGRGQREPYLDLTWPADGEEEAS